MKDLTRLFGCSFLINLPEREDRLREAMTEFAAAGWELGSNGIQVFSGRRFSDRAGFPNTGVRGAFHSHWGCIQRAQDGRCSALILEDDIGLSPALAVLTSSIAEWLQSSEWDFVFFGHYGTGSLPDATSQAQPESLQFESWTDEIYGLHFYGVNARILDRLVAHLERVANGVEGDQENGPMPVDGAINNFRRKNPDVKTFIVIPKLGWQRPSRSDITPNALDRIRVLRPLTAAARIVKRMVSSRSS